MTERPIPFTGAMVRAILDGRKTMTRRVVKPQPFGPIWPVTHLHRRGASVWSDHGSWTIKCPYGVPGDRLWVREALRITDSLRYEADGHPVDPVPDDAPTFTRDYRPPMLMPRWASRLTLEVTGVRVERLQGISEDDAIDEGADMPFAATLAETRRRVREIAFPALWDSINAARGFGWDANPWVWVVEFKTR